MSIRRLRISESITRRESQSLDKYLREVNKLELISPEEEARLAILIKQGDKKALERLIKANLRFVVSVAKQYQNLGLSLSDLINEGNIGLIEAARSFDQTRGFKFISYAVWWVRRNIVQALRADARMVRLPINKIALQGRIQRAGSMLEQKLGRTVTVEELAEELNMNSAEITVGFSMNEKHISLDLPLSKDGEESMLDVLENPNAVQTDKEINYTRSLKIEIERSFQILSKQQKETLCYLFGIGVDYPLSLEAIGIKLNLSRERVRQIKNNAIDKLRTCGNFNLLRSFLCA